MSVSNLAASYLDRDSVRVSWSGGTAPYRVYVDGVLELTTSATSCVLALDGGELIDVLDSTETAGPARPARVRLYWRGAATASEYRVYEYVSGAWTLRETIPDDGRGHYGWTSRRLEDVTTHQFKIASRDAVGNESSGDELSLYLVRHPDPPALSYSTAPTGGQTLVDAAGNTLVDAAGNTLVLTQLQALTITE